MLSRIYHHPAFKYIPFFCGFLAWVVFRVLFPNTVGATDVFHFKDPGCNLALGHGLTSNSYIGTNSFDREVWLSQGPIFPIVFSVFAKIFGCNYYANAIFDMTVSLFLSFQIFILAANFLKGFGIILFASLIGLFAPTGGYAWPTDRPDHLALVIVLAILLLNQHSRWQFSSSWAFFLSGLAFLVSPFYGVVSGIIAAITSFRDGFQNPSLIVWRILTGGLVAAAPIVLVVVIYQIIDPGSIQRFLRHAGIIYNIGLVDGLRRATFSADLTNILRFARGVIGFFLIVFALLSLRRNEIWTPPGVLLCAITLLFFTTPLVFPRQSNYFSALAFLAVASIFWSISVGGIRPDRRAALVFASGLTLFLPLLPGFIFETTRAVQTQESFEQERRILAAIAPTLRDPTGQKVVLAPATHYFLVKEAFDSVFNFNYIFPAYDRSRVAASVICRAGKLPTDPFPPKELAKANLISTGAFQIKPVQLRIFNYLIARRYWDWGCIVAERTHAD